MDAARRAELRRALLAAAPWIDADDVGPRSVDAGPCDRCAALPRLLPTCGPAAPGAICRPCAEDLGTMAWCDGHRDEAITALDWARRLPDDWPTTVIAWWIATGEVSEQASTDQTEAGQPAPVSADEVDTEGHEPPA